MCSEIRLAHYLCRKCSRTARLECCAFFGHHRRRLSFIDIVTVFTKHEAIGNEGVRVRSAATQFHFADVCAAPCRIQKYTVVFDCASRADNADARSKQRPLVSSVFSCNKCQLPATYSRHDYKLSAADTSPLETGLAPYASVQILPQGAVASPTQEARESHQSIHTRETQRVCTSHVYRVSSIRLDRKTQKYKHNLRERISYALVERYPL